MMREILFGLIVVVLAGLLYWQLHHAKRIASAFPEQLLGPVMSLMSEPKLAAGTSVGTWILTGIYRDRQFQLKAIVDTLAARKLPSLWLMVTLPEVQNVKASLNLMMRPSGPTSFSNFDFLPETLPTPADFPLHAVLRTDNSALCPSFDVLRHHLGLFHSRYGKELLISANGLRIVVQVAEVDRLRYGVFREANFGTTQIDANLAKQAMDELLSLHSELQEEHV